MLTMFANVCQKLGAAMLVAGNAIVGCVPLAAQSVAWPDYRGPNSNGWVVAADVPLEWSEQRNVVWKSATLGTGWSSPVVADGQIWLTAATDNGKKLHVLAFDLATGKTLFEQVVFANEQPEKKNALNSYASPSPTIEVSRVYVHFGTYGTACYDTKQLRRVWQRRDINCDHMEGPGSSPIVFEDLLIFNVDGGDVQYAIALDKLTGETKWRSDRSLPLSDVAKDERKAYSTPIVCDVAGKSQLISSGAQGSYAYDPHTGKELWRLRYKGFSMASRPMAADGMVFLTTGFMRAQMLGVRVPAEGDVTDTHIAWSYARNVPKMASPVLAGKRIFMVDDGGFATCLEAATGEALWRERLGGEHCASPLCIGDRVYFFDREGQSVVLRNADKFEQLASNQLDDGFMATPAVVGDAFVMRTRTHLYCIAARK